MPLKKSGLELMGAWEKCFGRAREMSARSDPG